MKLSEQQVQEFEEQGYLFIPEVFDREEIGVLADALPELYSLDRPEVWREKDGKAVRTAFAAHHYHAAFARLAAHPRMIGPVEQLLDGPVYIHQYKVNGKEAFDGDVWQWHQDYGTWARDDLMPTARAMNIAVFIDEVTEFNGPLMFIPKSHRQGKLSAGHDLETTSYPPLDPRSRHGHPARRRRWYRCPKGAARLTPDVPLQPGALLAAEHQPLAADHRLRQRLPRRESHSPFQAGRMDRPSQLHARSLPVRRLSERAGPVTIDSRGVTPP